MREFNQHKTLCVLLPPNKHHNSHAAWSMADQYGPLLDHYRIYSSRITRHHAPQDPASHFRPLLMCGLAELSMGVFDSTTLGTPRLNFFLSGRDGYDFDMRGVFHNYAQAPEHFERIEACLIALDSLTCASWPNFDYQRELQPIKRGIALAWEAMRSKDPAKLHIFRRNMGVEPSAFVTQNFVDNLHCVDQLRFVTGMMPSKRIHALQIDIRTLTAAVSETARLLGHKLLVESASDSAGFIQTRNLATDELPPHRIAHPFPPLPLARSKRSKTPAAAESHT